MVKVMISCLLGLLLFSLYFQPSEMFSRRSLNPGNLAFSPFVFPTPCTRQLSQRHRLLELDAASEGHQFNPLPLAGGRRDIYRVAATCQAQSLLVEFCITDHLTETLQESSGWTSWSLLLRQGDRGTEKLNDLRMITQLRFKSSF